MYLNVQAGFHTEAAFCTAHIYEVKHSDAVDNTNMTYMSAMTASHALHQTVVCRLSPTHTNCHIGRVTRLNLPGRLGIKPKEQLRFGDNLHPPTPTPPPPPPTEEIKMISVTLT